MAPGWRSGNERTPAPRARGRVRAGVDLLQADAAVDLCGSLLIGAFAVWKLPREEEPQIIVPMIDVFVQMPGASAREVEERVTKPMEKLLWEIPGRRVHLLDLEPGHVDGDRAFLWWARTKRRASSG